MKYTKYLMVICIFSLTSCDTLKQVAGDVLGEEELTPAEIALGLKQALEFGISDGADKLSQVDGYFKSPYKILLPQEAMKVTEKLKIIPGFDKVEDIILEKINRGAEDAAKSAKPIFVEAITNMTFDDALNILMGPPDAATQYLNKSTYTALYAEFKPVITESLNKFNAIEYWEDAVNTYNKIPLVDEVNPRLDDYVTIQALQGLFTMVQKKEGRIRADVSERTTDLLKKVFAKQDKE